MDKISERFSHLSALRQAFLALEKMQSQLEAKKKSQAEPIAIIGMGCRVPGGGNNPESFWDLLRNGRDATGEIPLSRWNIEAFYDEDKSKKDRMYVKRGGFLDIKVDEFDANFFEIAPREVKSMDPQQRLLLEVSWEALEYGGISPAKLGNSLTGVFIGINPSDYSRVLENSDESLNLGPYFFTGNTPSVAAGRLSYNLGLKGPALSIDTSCSSSLVGIHLACQSLRNQECKMALAGGVNLILSPQGNIVLSNMRALAQDGRCKTFDDGADGYGRGEGCGIVVLKCVSDAIADGDNILAVIRGSAINHDGRSSGLTVPNGLAQQDVIREALANANVKPNAVSYVEAHGTGTSLGDPIEVEALNAVYGEGRLHHQPLVIGSVKTNIGHLEAAAGVVSLIKVVLAMQHGEIPPHLHLKKPNHAIDWENIPVIISTELKSWHSYLYKDYQENYNNINSNNRDYQKLLAGVSSFGMSGTNIHLIIEEPPVLYSKNNKKNNSEIQERPFHILTISGKNKMALRDLALAYQKFLFKNTNISLQDLCFTANTGRWHFDYRWAVKLSSIEELQENLGEFIENFPNDQNSNTPLLHSSNRKIAFLFTGQGSQYINMGYELYQNQPTFRQVIDYCNEILQLYLEKSLLEVLYPKDNLDLNLLNETNYTQPALFAIEYALAKLWQSWGIEPSVVMGHSVGEYVAACIAGVFSLEDGLKLIAQRGNLMERLPRNGKMVTVFASESQVLELIKPFEGKVAIAANNGPSSIVISGISEIVDLVIEKLSKKRIEYRLLKVSHAFHSPLMNPILASFEIIASEIEYKEPRIRIISNLNGQQVERGEITNPSYWVRHIRESVQFYDSIQTLENQEYDLFLEIGPHPVLLGMGQRCLPENTATWLPSLRSGYSDWEQILNSLCKLYMKGVTVNWDGFEENYIRKKVSLPTYPFQRKSYWAGKIEKPQPIPENNYRDWLYEIVWQPQEREIKSVPNWKESGIWLVFADKNQGIGRKLSEKLNSLGETVILVFEGKTYQQLGEGEWAISTANPEDFQNLVNTVLNQKPCRGIVHLWNLDSTPTEEITLESLEKDQLRNCGSVLYLVQALNLTKISQTNLWIVTQESQALSNRHSLAMAQTPIWGLGRVVAMEHPELWGGLIDVGSGNSEEIASSLFEELLRQEIPTEVAFLGKQRYVSRLVSCPVENHNGKSSIPQFSTMKADGAYLITGGLGGLGLKCAQWMVNLGAKHLLLVGRSTPKESAVRTISGLEAQGVQIDIIQADISKSEDVAFIIKKYHSLKGIIHLAGVLEDGILRNQTWSRFVNVMSPKVKGTWNLHTFTKDLDLDFFVCFSSIASVLGSPGQGNYAAGNSFLDSLVYHRKLQNLPALTINWSPWGETGMAASLGDKGEQRWKNGGVTPIEPSQGFELLGQLLRQNLGQITILPIDWEKFFQVFSGGIEETLLFNIANKVKRKEKVDEKPLLLQQLQEILPEKQKGFLIKQLQKDIAKALELDDSQIPEPNLGFFDMGMDSLMALEFKNQLQAGIGQTLSATLTFEYPNIEALATYLLEEVLIKDDASPSNSENMEDENLTQELEDIQQLSDDELQALIENEFQSLMGN